MKKALLFVDNLNQASKWKKLFSRNGWEVKTTSSLTQFLSLLHGIKPELSLVEKSMPLQEEDPVFEILLQESQNHSLLMVSPKLEKAYLWDTFLDVIHPHDKNKVSFWIREKERRPWETKPKSRTFTDNEFQSLSQCIEKEFAFVVQEKSHFHWKKDLASRMKVLGFSHVQDYLQFLKTSPYRKEELLKLFHRLTIPETTFFRTKSHFEALREKIVPALLAKEGPSPTLKIWSCGCSTGEEAYSLAILMEELKENYSFDYSILATDINYGYLKAAKKGAYPLRSLRNLSLQQRKRFFVIKGNQFLVRPSLKEKIVFDHFNINSREKYFDPSRWEEFHIIFCENVLIYFSPPRIEEIIQKFYRLLKDKGVLFLGYSESLLHISHSFQSCSFDDKVFYYQKAFLPQPEKKEEDAKVSPPSLLSSSSSLSSPTCSLKKSSPLSSILNHDGKSKIAEILSISFGYDIIDSLSKPLCQKGEEVEINKDWEIFLEMDGAMRKGDFICFKRGVEKIFGHPEGKSRLLELWVAHLRAGQYVFVEGVLEVFRSSMPNHPERFYLEGLFHQSQNQDDKAKECFEKALYVDPYFVPAHFQMGEYYAKKGNIHRAKISFSQVLKFFSLKKIDKILTLEGNWKKEELYKICKQHTFKP
ncbi:MAG: hypothetical protein D6785_14695 [Planctomycetota bacterium]|nr:MAG: hypothetical protein D6785_14695 [Planctomycetota bacterium]